MEETSDSATFGQSILATKGERLSALVIPGGKSFLFPSVFLPSPFFLLPSPFISFLLSPFSLLLSSSLSLSLSFSFLICHLSFLIFMSFSFYCLSPFPFLLSHLSFLLLLSFSFSISHFSFVISHLIIFSHQVLDGFRHHSVDAFPLKNRLAYLGAADVE